MLRGGARCGRPAVARFGSVGRPSPSAGWMFRLGRETFAEREVRRPAPTAGLLVCWNVRGERCKLTDSCRRPLGFGESFGP